MRLSDYISDTAALLADQSNLFTSPKQLTRNINESRRLIAMYTACIRRLLAGQTAWGGSSQPGFGIPGAIQPGALPSAIPQAASLAPGAGQSLNMATIPGAERYPFEGFFNPYLRASYGGCDSVLNVVQLSINWGGPSRPALDWLPWDEFQAYCRAYAFQNLAYPSVWAVLNDGSLGEVWIFPTPSQQLDMEALVDCLPSNLVDDNSPEALPLNFQDNVKYAAAALTFMQRQQFSLAEVHDRELQRRIGISVVSRDRGKSRSYYVGAY